MKNFIAFYGTLTLLLSTPVSAATPIATGDTFLNYSCTGNLANVQGSTTKFDIQVRELEQGQKFAGSSRVAINFGGHLPSWFVMSRQRINSGRAILSGWLQLPSQGKSGTFGGGLDSVHPFVFATIKGKQAVVICDLQAND